MGTVLVAYATKNGSTQQVAEAIAARLRRDATVVDCRPAREVREPIDDFDLVVLGAPLYSGRWHRDAHRFLKRHRGQPRAIAVYGMGPRSDDAQAWQRSRAQLDRALAKHRGLAPMSVALFGGADPPRRAGRRDLRDWTAIDTWADQVGRRAASPRKAWPGERPATG